MILLIIFLQCVTNFDLDKDIIYVEGGTFQMGNKGERYYKNMWPCHKVVVNSFYISKYEVTYLDFFEYIKYLENSNNKKLLKGIVKNLDRNIYIKRKGKFTLNKDYSEFPVVNVTWETANAYCRWKGGRLPTEAEWDYAASGGKHQIHKIYSGCDTWNGDCGSTAFYSIEKVGKYKPNVLGLYDMSGNASEMCSDWYTEMFGIKFRHNPKGPPNGKFKVTKGGIPIYSRGAAKPFSYGTHLGFRICYNEK